MKKYPNTKVYKDLANSLLNDSKGIIHNINDFVIHNYNGNIHIINKQSMQLIEAESEQQAVDFCLDFYKSSISKQIQINNMEKLKLNLDDMVLIGRHGDFGKAVDPLEDKLEKVMIGVDSGLEDCICVDLDGDLEIKSIYQLQDNTTEQEIRDFVVANIQQVSDKVRDEIAYKISDY